jgi:hypothetical protein
MQVFLPEPDFDIAAQQLDTKRLVKQLLEGRQIMTILVGESKSNAWKNHPAVRMFDGHPYALYNYLRAIRNEMQRREYKWRRIGMRLSACQKASQTQGYRSGCLMTIRFIMSLLPTVVGYMKKPQIYTHSTAQNMRSTRSMFAAQEDAPTTGLHTRSLNDKV